MTWISMVNLGNAEYTCVLGSEKDGQWYFTVPKYLPFEYLLQISEGLEEWRNLLIFISLEHRLKQN